MKHSVARSFVVAAVLTLLAVLASRSGFPCRTAGGGASLRVAGLEQGDEYKRHDQYKKWSV